MRMWLACAGFTEPRSFRLARLCQRSQSRQQSEPVERDVLKEIEAQFEACFRPASI